MEKRIWKTIGIGILLLLSCAAAHAQHTLGLTGGYGQGTARFYPAQETKAVWGLYSGGVAWRYYSAQRFVGCVGADLELLQHAFSYAPYASTAEEGEALVYYTRRLNSVTVPIVWQPYFYLANRHIRVFLEAAVTFSYRFGSTYQNDVAHELGAEDWKGDYEFRRTRDNRWGYGLAGGAGIAVLVGRTEISAGARYYFGLSDLLRNRNKYYNNELDGSENPFGLTPMRSPLDNLMIRVGVAYRFAPEFKVWNAKPRKREHKKEGFGYTLE